MVVKGSKQYRSVVIPYRPLKRLFWGTLLLVIIFSVAFSCYRYGYSEAQRDYQEAMQEWNRLHELNSQQAEQLQQLNQQVANSQVGTSVNQKAMEELRQEIVRINELNASLQESNNFYRQLMDMPENKKGLAISSFTITAASEPRHFHYELLIQQLTTEHRMSTGKITIMINGVSGDQPHSYSIAELSDKLPKADIPMKLRFYQTVAGDMLLPEGFEPKRIEVSAEKSGVPAVTASFDWVVKN